MESELFTTLNSAFRFIRSRVNVASLIHSLIRPLSLPLLSGEILRGLTLEFLPCASYPLFTHTRTHTFTLPHISYHWPKILWVCIFASLCVTERWTNLQNNYDFLDSFHIWVTILLSILAVDIDPLVSSLITGHQIGWFDIDLICKM